MPGSTLKIENARYIVTLDSERRIVAEGSILVEGQRITRVGKAADLANVGADRVIDGRRFVVTPGLFNGHMHISYAHAVRGIFPDDVENRLRHVFDLQWAMTDEEEYQTTLLGLVELLRNGTTCFLDPGTTRFPDACLQAYIDSGIRVVTCQSLNDREAPVKLAVLPTDAAVTRTAAFIEAWDGRLDGRIRAWAATHSVDTASAELLQGLKRVADERGVGLTIHHSTGEAARRQCQAEHGTTPTEYLERLGVLGSNVLLAHGLGLNDAELDAIARSGASVAMCPVTAMKEGHGVGQQGRMPDLLTRGVAVVLGSDSANSANHLDGVRNINMAALQYKDARQDTHLIPAETAVEMATINGARAFGQADSLGSIEVGKQADLVLFDTQRPEWQALINPINNLVYNADGRSVHTVIVDGHVVVEDYRQKFAEEERLYQQVQEIGEKLQARTGITFPRSRWPIV